MYDEFTESLDEVSVKVVLGKVLLIVGNYLF